MPVLDSFKVDHRKLKAPAIRIAKSFLSPSGEDTVFVLDLRVKTPNAEEPLAPDVIHTMEHLLAGFVRDRLKAMKYTDLAVIDISPMGCRTGFYMSVIQKGYLHLKMTSIIDSVMGAFKDILSAEGIPEANEIQCGTHYMHNLDGAKVEAFKLVGVGWNIYNNNDSLQIDEETCRKYGITLE